MFDVDHEVATLARFEAVARGHAPPESLVVDVAAALRSDAPGRVIGACDALWVAAAYRRRSRFERENFAEVPDYCVAPHFDFPVALSPEDVTRLDERIASMSATGHPLSDRARRAAHAFNEGVAELGFPFRLGSPAVGGSTWYPGSRYREEPMRADAVRTFADERRLVRRLERQIQETVERVARVTACPHAHGNHAKATVLAATLEADPDARPAWRALFGGRTHPGGLRFSNSAPDLRTVDHKGNLVGFRFSFLLDPSREVFDGSQAEGGWMTLTANSAPRAHVATPERHILFTLSVGSPHAGPGDLLGDLTAGSASLTGKVRDVGRAVREVATAIPQGRAVSARPELHRLDFHSRHAYRLGAQAVRYVVRVVAPEFPPAQDGWGADPDYRHRTLLEVVSGAEVTATIGLQVLPDRDPGIHDAWSTGMIEDMRADWTGVPIQPFGIVRIPRQGVAPTAERNRMVRWFADNPVDLRVAGGWFAPLGAAGRSRTPVYAASQVARRTAPPLGLPPRLDSTP